MCKRLVSLICPFLGLMVGCIPITDELPPQVAEFEQLAEIYFYQDTLEFTVAFTDNSLLDSGVVQISKSSQDIITPNDWDSLFTVELLGRRFEQTYKIRVPEYKTPGLYDLTVFGFDSDGNPTSQAQTFILQADRTLPQFHELEIGLSQNDDGSYLACRSEIVTVSGGVSDNLSVNRLGFSITNGNQDQLAVFGDSLSVSEFFGNAIIIPPNVVDNTLLTLTIFATDTFQNQVSQDFLIRVDCDDRPPTINVNRTSPTLNSANNAPIVQGTSFKMEEVFVEDNRFLRNITLYYNLQGAALEERINLDVDTTGTVNLADLADLTFEIPEEAPVGQINEITIVATDSVGNFSEPVIITLTVTEDEPPVIIVTNTYVNRREQPFSANDPLAVNLRDFITLDGKIEEAKALNSLEMFWGLEGSAEPVVSESEFESLPLNLADFHDETTFVIPRTAEVGQVYELSILVVDSREQESSVSYRFVVSE